MDRQLKKLTIQEVSQRAGITKHTLRFWEKELEGLIMPLRTKGGQRRYTAKHLLVIEEIKRLKNDGLSLAHIKEQLNNRYNSNSTNSNSQGVEDLADRVAEIVRSAIYNFFEGGDSD